MTNAEPENLALISRAGDIFHLGAEEVRARLHPDFTRYFIDLFKDPLTFRTYVNEVRYLARVGAIKGCALDLAAGFGLTGICLRALNVDRVTCMDLVETKVVTGIKLAELVGVDGFAFRQGDASNLPFEGESFDAVLIKDAASHFRYPMRVYSEAARVLRRGGRLVILDDRNGLNPRVQELTRGLWEISETGTREELAALGLKISFSEMRRKYIAERFPEIPPDRVVALANETRGYTFGMLAKAIPLLLEGKPSALEPAAECIDPDSEIVQERLIDPVGLCRELRTIGLRAKVLPPVGWDPKTWMQQRGDLRGLLRRAGVRAVWSMPKLRPLLIRRMGKFVIVAVKH